MTAEADHLLPSRLLLVCRFDSLSSYLLEFRLLRSPLSYPGWPSHRRFYQPSRRWRLQRLSGSLSSSGSDQPIIRLRSIINFSFLLVDLFWGWWILFAQCCAWSPLASGKVLIGFWPRLMLLIHMI